MVKQGGMDTELAFPFEGLMTDLLSDLTPDQREAVTHFEGPVLVLAGAGSGKTRVITRRVAYLLQQGVKPSQILAITFTNKAAGEMRQRVEALVPNCKVWISTFHSFGVRMLRQYGERLGLNRNFTIYDQTDRNRLVKSALESAGIDNVRFTPERIQAAISKAKNDLISPEKYAIKADDFFKQTVARAYPVYEKKLRDANALDFDDLLLWPALGMKHVPELRAELDARFRFVLIDEYQDTNSAQYAIAHGLSMDQPNLCVVGDPDQSIYGWRGANIHNILEFERDFPNTRVIALERNYRSTKNILHAASCLIAHNRKRKPKTLVTENGVGQPVRVLKFDTGLEEADGIARSIQEAVTGGRRGFRDFAIFVRVNALSRALESAFIKRRVPYQIVRGLAFFERKENKDVLAYLRLLLNPRDDLSFLRVVNEPARGIGKVSLEHLRSYAEPREMSYLLAAAEVDRISAIKGKAAAGIRNFAHLMQELSQAVESAPEDLIRQVLDRTGYRQMLQTSTDPEDEERLANIEELITAAREFTAEDSTRTIADFLETITLASDVDGWDERQDCVAVMTLHAAKGLEFPVVYMAAVESGLLPHERSIESGQEQELEEERRLAFVGMTRAKEELYLCHAQMRDFRGRTQYSIGSMFLEELPEEGVERVDLSTGTSRVNVMNLWRGGSSAAGPGWTDAGFQPDSDDDMMDVDEEMPAPGDSAFAEGMLVRHQTYGPGRITEVSGYGALRKVKIRFSAHGEKTFVADKVKLTVVARS
jgi:DNA helicase-2/ATP-dependent DNA helicase PcrA